MNIGLLSQTTSQPAYEDEDSIGDSELPMVKFHVIGSRSWKFVRILRKQRQRQFTEHFRSEQRSKTIVEDVVQAVRELQLWSESRCSKRPCTEQQRAISIHIHEQEYLRMPSFAGITIRLVFPSTEFRSET